MAVSDCHSPVAKAAEIWSRAVLTYPTPSPGAALHAHLYHLHCTDISLHRWRLYRESISLKQTGKAQLVGTRLRGSRFTRNDT